MLPPTLAYEIGLAASKRVRDIREGRATMEGVFTGPALGFVCDCQQEDLHLSTKHPKRFIKGLGPVAQLVGR